MHYHLLEFKRPRHQLTRDDQNQAEKYRDDLLSTFQPIEIVLVGGSVDPKLNFNPPENVSFLSYAAVISNARQQLNWLLTNLTMDKSSAASTASAAS